MTGQSEFKVAQLKQRVEAYDVSSSETTLVVEGLAALTLIKDDAFRRSWATLHAACPWATSCQSYDFVTVWYRVYGDRYDPVIVRQTDSIDRLTGLLTLARERESGALVVAGAHQAEYHAWLATPDESDNFIKEALDLLRRDDPHGALTFKFLAPGAPTGWLDGTSPWNGRAIVRVHKRPLLAFGNGDSIAASLKKKSNKSRLNRLKRLGALNFKEISTTEEFSAIIDQIADQYDLRQGAVNGSVPFGDDPLKKTFLLELMRCTDLLHVSVLTLDDVPVAAVIANREKDLVSVGVFSHSPFQAKHSPGKFHLLFLGSLLAEQGFTALDLTPGGDWKDRFATTFDDVLEVALHFNPATAQRARKILKIEAVASRLCRAIGVKPDTVRSLPGKLRRLSVAKVIKQARRRIWSSQNFRLYAYDMKMAAPISAKPVMSVNRLGTLLRFKPSEDWQTRDLFLSQALYRLEAGDRVYSMVKADRLLHYGWLEAHAKKSYFSEVEQSYEYPPGSAVLYDFYTSPDARGQGFYQQSLSQMLQDSAENDGIEKVYISVLADNGASRHVIEKLGFEYLTSFHKTVRFGITRRWSDLALQEPSGNDEEPRR